MNKRFFASLLLLLAAFLLGNSRIDAGKALGRAEELIQIPHLDWPFDTTPPTASMNYDDEIEEWISGANGVDLDYVLTIDNPSSGQATVIMTISNLETNTFEIEEPGLYVNLLSLSAVDSSGNPLVIEHKPNSGSDWFGQQVDVWQVQCEGLSQIVIEYEIQPGLTDGMHGYRGYIAPDFAALAGEYVFLIPRGTATNGIAVSFNHPSDWHSFTPWYQQGNVYYPATSIPGANAIESLITPAFALGQFDIFKQKVGNTEVTVAAYNEWSNDVKKGLAKKSWDIFNYQTSVFGVSVGDRYLAIFLPMAPDGENIYFNEWSTSQGYSISFEENGSYWGKWDMFAHQSFHRWNGWAWGMEGYHNWFGEGPNVLYEMKTVTELQMGQPSSMEDDLRFNYEKYLNEYVGTDRDKPLASEISYSDLDTFIFLVYRKGAMVSFLIAKEIYLRTDGAHNFDDFLQILFQKYGHYQAPCSEECLKEELATLTGTDFTQFFDDYVYGTTTLPMDWAFEDSDDDGLSNALEIGWDTHPEKEDTDGDGFSDAVEIDERSDPLDPSSIPNLVYLPVVFNNYAPPLLPIRIDGEGQEWQAYTPVATDPQGDTIGGPHTDMKAIFSETGPNYVYLMVEAYDPPLLPDATIELNLFLVDRGGRVQELNTNIEPDGRFFAWVDIDGDDNWEEYPISGVLSAWGNMMELRLPLQQLGNPDLVQVDYVHFWASVDGQWTGVDIIDP